MPHSSYFLKWPSHCVRSLDEDIKDVVCFSKLHIFFLLCSFSGWGFKPCLCFRCLVWRVFSSGERLRGAPAPEHCYWWDSLPFRNFCLLWAHSDFLRITEKLSPQTETEAHGLVCLAPLPSPGAVTCFFFSGLTASIFFWAHTLGKPLLGQGDIWEQFFILTPCFFSTISLTFA